MKKFLMVLICMSIGIPCFAGKYLGTSIPVAGNSKVPAEMQAMILGPVFRYGAQNTVKCRKLKFSNAKVTEEPKNLETNKRGKYISGNWKEEWTLDACGTEVKVPIEFLYDKRGLRFFITE